MLSSRSFLTDRPQAQVRHTLHGVLQHDMTALLKLSTRFLKALSISRVCTNRGTEQTYPEIGQESQAAFWSEDTFVDRTKEFFEGLVNVCKGKFSDNIQPHTLYGMFASNSESCLFNRLSGSVLDTQPKALSSHWHVTRVKARSVLVGVHPGTELQSPLAPLAR